MRKKKRIRSNPNKYFLPILLLVVFLLFGIQSAFAPFSTTPPGGAYHTESQIVCNNCIDQNNIGTGAVGTDEIADGAIADQDISPTANINPTKINHPNGVVFSFQTTGNPVPIPETATMGVTNWHGRYIETICGGPPVYSGIQDMTFNTANQVISYQKGYNHYAGRFLPFAGTGNGASVGSIGGSCYPASCTLPGVDWVPIYQYFTYNVAGGSSTTTSILNIYLRVDPTNPAQLEIGEIAAPASNFIPIWPSCMIKYVQ